MNDDETEILRRGAEAALGTVLDPELDEPITDLGFVRSLAVAADGSLVVHLRLPTSFCSPNFAYLMASDAKDALSVVPGVTSVVVELDDHHDSERINRGLAADAGYRGTFGSEADQSLDALRLTFLRKSHVAAMERSLTTLLREQPALHEAALPGVTVADLPSGRTTDALLRRRAALGFATDRSAVVLVEDDGTPGRPDRAGMLLRRARSVRVSMDGNAHFCRGLLRTRYPGCASDQKSRAQDSGAVLPLIELEASAS